MLSWVLYFSKGLFFIIIIIFFIAAGQTWEYNKTTEGYIKPVFWAMSYVIVLNVIILHMH